MARVAATGFMRGHPIHTTSDDYMNWFYEDGTPADDSRPCVRCGKMPLPNGEDACLGHIDGLVAACCGHGVHEPERMTIEEYRERFPESEEGNGCN